MNISKDGRSSERLNRSLFFLVAILLHLIIFLMAVGYVVFPTHPVVKDQDFDRTYLTSVPPVPPKPPVNIQAPSFSGPDTPVPIHMQGLSPGISIKPGDLMNGLDGGPSNQAEHDPGVPVPHGPPLKLAPRVDLHAVQDMHELWDPRGDGQMRFPIYLAKYADGDWNCNHDFHDGKLTSGCLPNLLAKVDEWSHGELKSNGIKVVALDSPELVQNPPPFVFFTGHKDFHLTEPEVANLRKYLQNGGAIWGDSAFAGDGSRFDVAFHREMKRVLPDADLNFEPLPADHDIFTKSKFQLEELPRGMNNRADPIECINLAGKLAVLYTPNDYSDMMTMLLLPGRDESSAQVAPEDRWKPDHPLYTPNGFLTYRSIYFRNYEAASAMKSYKLSMNILVHLLHRYDDELLLTP
jgi:hypothetical protein